MKNLNSVIAILFIILGLNSCSRETNPFVGSWEFVSYKQTTPDTTITGDNSNLQAIKILSSSHFALAALNPKDSTFSHGGAGSYTYDENKYSEIIKFWSRKEMIGNTYNYTYKFEGDTWNIAGDFEDAKYEEVWRRLK